jgi:hypothetical protein
LPAIIASGFSSILINPVEIAIEPRQTLTPSKHLNIHNHPGRPAIFHKLRPILLDQGTLHIHRIELTAVQIRVIDIGKEQLAPWANLKLIVVLWIGVFSSDEELHSVLGIEGGVAAFEVGDDVTVRV